MEKKALKNGEKEHRRLLLQSNFFTLQGKAAETAQGQKMSAARKLKFAKKETKSLPYDQKKSQTLEFEQPSTSKLSKMSKKDLLEIERLKATPKPSKDGLRLLPLSKLLKELFG